MTQGYVLGNEDYLNKLSDNQRINRHWTLVWIKEGAGMYLLDNSLRCLNEGDIILLPPRIDFSFTSGDLGDEYNINLKASVFRFDSTWLDALLAAFPALSDTLLRVRELRNPLSVHGPKWIKISSLFEELNACDKSYQPLGILELLSQLATEKDYSLIKEVRECDTQNVAEKMEKIERYLDCNYCSRISLEDIAGYVGMSRTYFCQFFKNQYKEGFSDHLTRIRVQKASVMLMHTDKPIPAVAEECGFKTVQYFTRAFRKVRGTTPGAFRRGGGKTVICGPSSDTL